MAAERSLYILQTLERSRRDLCSAANGFWETDAKHKPGPGRWSVLDCVEHVAVAEVTFLNFLKGARPLHMPRVDRFREARLLERLNDRTLLTEAPELLKPTGRYPSLSYALNAFDVARTLAVEFVLVMAQELYSLEVEHSRFGWVNGAELMAVIAGHAQRHAAQIREIRTALDATR